MEQANTTQQSSELLYAFSILTSVILAGVSEAVLKCSNNPGPPLCGLKQTGGSVKPAPVLSTVAVPAPLPGAKLAPVPLSAPVPWQDLINSEWLNTFMKLANVINDKLHNVVENVAMNAIDKVETYALGDLGTKQFGQSVLEHLQNKTLILEQMTRDPAVQKTIKDMAEELSILGIQVLDTAKPAIDKIMAKSLDTIKKSAATGAKGLFDAGLNTIVSTISLIPVYGGIIALVIAFLRGFNSAMLTAAPGIEFSTEAFFTALFTGIKLLQTFLKIQPKITQQADAIRMAVQNMNPATAVIKEFERKGQAFGNEYAAKAVGAEQALQQFKNIGNTASGAVSGVANKTVSGVVSGAVSGAVGKKLKQDGGRANMQKRIQIQKRIQHITQRLRQKINKFTRKFKPRPRR